MAFDPKRIDRLAAKATLLEDQVRALVAELEELAELARAEAAAPAPLPTQPPAAPVPAALEPAPAVEPVPQPEPPAEAALKPATAAPEGARLVALNMALRGTPRDETARYLRENYDFEDSDGLLDDVYLRGGSSG